MEKGSTKSIYRFFQLFLSNILSPLARRGGPTLAPCLIPFTNCQEQTFALCLTKKTWNMRESPTDTSLVDRFLNWKPPGFATLFTRWEILLFHQSIVTKIRSPQSATSICVGIPTVANCWWLKSGDHQLRLVLYPIVYNFFHTSQVVVWDFWTINSIICKLFCPKITTHQISISIDEWRPKAPAASNLRVFFHWWVKITSWWLNHPVEKYARKNGNLPQVWGERKVFETTT